MPRNSNNKDLNNSLILMFQALGINSANASQKPEEQRRDGITPPPPSPSRSGYIAPPPSPEPGQAQVSQRRAAIKVK